MSGTIANRPYGVGPFGTGPYNTYPAATVLAGARGGMTFSAAAIPGVTRTAAGGGNLVFSGRVTLRDTWEPAALCVPGTWGKAV